MRELVVAVDDTQAYAPNNLPTAAAVCSQDSPSSISASGVTPSILAQPIEGVGLTWDVKAVNGAQNGLAGGFLSGFLLTQRTLPGDEFYALMLP